MKIFVLWNHVVITNTTKSILHSSGPRILAICFASLSIHSADSEGASVINIIIKLLMILTNMYLQFTSIVRRNSNLSEEFQLETGVLYPKITYACQRTIQMTPSELVHN